MHSLATGIVILASVVLYVALIFLPAMLTPKSSPYKRTVELLCVISLIVPIVWIIALVFAMIQPPADRR